MAFLKGGIWKAKDLLCFVHTSCMEATRVTTLPMMQWWRAYRARLKTDSAQFWGLGLWCFETGQTAQTAEISRLSFLEFSLDSCVAMISEGPRDLTPQIILSRLSATFFWFQSLSTCFGRFAPTVCQGTYLGTEEEMGRLCTLFPGSLFIFEYYMFMTFYMNG